MKLYALRHTEKKELMGSYTYDDVTVIGLPLISGGCVWMSNDKDYADAVARSSPDGLIASHYSPYFHESYVGKLEVVEVELLVKDVA